MTRVLINFCSIEELILGWLWLLPPVPFLLTMIGLSPFWWDFAKLSPILPHSWCVARSCSYPFWR
jgi:hypothetical protein